MGEVRFQISEILAKLSATNPRIIDPVWLAANAEIAPNTAVVYIRKSKQQKMIHLETLSKVCTLLQIDPRDTLEWIEDETGG